MVERYGFESNILVISKDKTCFAGEVVCWLLTVSACRRGSPVRWLEPERCSTLPMPTPTRGSTGPWIRSPATRPRPSSACPSSSGESSLESCRWSTSTTDPSTRWESPASGCNEGEKLSHWINSNSHFWNYFNSFVFGYNLFKHNNYLIHAWHALHLLVNLRIFVFLITVPLPVISWYITE